MSVVIALEPFSAALFREILPLAQKCWEEATILKAETCAFYGERDFQIEPDEARYHELAAIRTLVIVTLRQEGVLEGYVEGFLYRSLHHQKILAGIGDTLYVNPSLRSYTGPLVDRFLEEMRVRHAQIIGWPVTPGSSVHKVLLTFGFVGDDVVMEKRL